MKARYEDEWMNPTNSTAVLNSNQSETPTLIMNTPYLEILSDTWSSVNVVKIMTSSATWVKLIYLVLFPFSSTLVFLSFFFFLVKRRWALEMSFRQDNDRHLALRRQPKRDVQGCNRPLIYLNNGKKFIKVHWALQGKDFGSKGLMARWEKIVKEDHKEAA